MSILSINDDDFAEVSSSGICYGPISMCCHTKVMT